MYNEKNITNNIIIKKYKRLKANIFKHTIWIPSQNAYMPLILIYI